MYLGPIKAVYKKEIEINVKHQEQQFLWADLLACKLESQEKVLKSPPIGGFCDSAICVLLERDFPALT